MTDSGLHFTGQLLLDRSRSPATEYRAILGWAEESDRPGFDSIWLSEHHFADDSHLPSISPMLAAVAAQMERAAFPGVAVDEVSEAIATFAATLRQALGMSTTLPTRA